MILTVLKHRVGRKISLVNCPRCFVRKNKTITVKIKFERTRIDIEHVRRQQKKQVCFIFSASLRQMYRWSTCQRDLLRSDWSYEQYLIDNFRQQINIRGFNRTSVVDGRVAEDGEAL